MSQCSGIRHLTSRSATKQPHLKINAPPPPRPPPLLLLLFLHPNATCSQRVLLAERRRRRSVAMFVQAHAFVLAEGDGPRPLCRVPRAQPLSQVLKMPRSLVLQLGLSAVPLVNRTLRGVLGQPVHECLRPASEGMQAEGPGICSGTAEGEVSICKTTKKEIVFLLHFRQGVCVITGMV